MGLRLSAIHPKALDAARAFQYITGMFGIDTSLTQAARILAAPIWVLDFILAAAGGAAAWWWFKGRK